jgi:hypothetical protein
MLFGSALTLYFDDCGPYCTIDQYTAGAYLAMILSGALFAASVVWAIVRFVRRTIGFWVILLGCVAAIAGYTLGVGIASSAQHSSAFL